MTLIPVDRNLMRSEDDPAAQTHIGQAHFGGTGPFGATCGQCAHWKDSPTKRIKVCHKQAEMARGKYCLTALPSTAAACKYFVNEPRKKGPF